MYESISYLYFLACFPGVCMLTPQACLGITLAQTVLKRNYRKTLVTLTDTYCLYCELVIFPGALTLRFNYIINLDVKKYGVIFYSMQISVP